MIALTLTHSLYLASEACFLIRYKVRESKRERKTDVSLPSSSPVVKKLWDLLDYGQKVDKSNTIFVLQQTPTT